MGRSRWLSLLLALQMLLAAIPRPAVGAEPSFADVVGTPYEQPVQALAALGIVRGASASSYEPNGAVSRSHIAALLVRALRLSRSPEAEPLPQTFTDVPPDFWAFTEIALAAEAGIITGTASDRFAPDDPVTYGQATAMAVRALGYENGRLAYPEGYREVATQLRLLDGLQWEPDRLLSRGEAAILLANAIFKVKHGALDRTLSQAYFRHAVALRIRPEGETLAAGMTDMSVIGTDAYGNELPVLPAAWRLLAGTGTITESGLLTASPGQVTVEATVQNLAITASYRVVPSLAVVPSAGLFQPGDSVQLQAVMELTRADVPDATWTVLSGPGAVTETGLLSFLAPGTVVVEAALGTSRAKASLTVASLLRLHPAAVTMAPGETRTFTVIGPDGRPLPGPFEWRVDGAGTITPEGVYTATAGARTSVQVRSGDLMGAAQVQVVDRLAIGPAGALTTHKNAPLQLTATAVTGDGTSVTVPIIWSTAGPGTIDATGLFTPKAPGPVRITARYGSVTETVTVTVADDPARIELHTSRESVPANGATPVALTLTLLDTHGTVVSGLDTSLRFVLSGPGASSVTEQEVQTTNGVATATWVPGTTPGTYRVAAQTLGLVSNSVQIDATVPVPSAIRLSADPASIPALPHSKATITTILLDTEGQEIANPTGAPIAIALQVRGAALEPATVMIGPGASRAQTSLHAGPPGAATVTGTSPYPVESATIRTTAVGDGRLTIRPLSEPVRADGITTMVVTVDLHDTNDRPMLGPVTVTLTAVSADGRTTLPVQRETAERGVATFYLKTAKAGSYRVTVAAPELVGDSQTVTFNAGQAIGVKLSAYPTPYLRADGTSKLILRAELVDAQGNVATGATGQVTFNRVMNGGATAGTGAATVTIKSGVAEWELTASHTAGTDGFRATVEGLGESDLFYVFTQN